MYCLGKGSEAHKELKEAARALRQLLPTDHPYSVQCAANLKVVLQGRMNLLGGRPGGVRRGVERKVGMAAVAGISKKRLQAAVTRRKYRRVYDNQHAR